MKVEWQSMLADFEKLQRRMKHDREMNRLVRAVVTALKGRTDLEIREWGQEIERRLTDLMKLDGTSDPANWRRARRRRDKALREQKAKQ